MQTKVIWLRVEEWGEVGWEGIKKGENCSPLATSKWGGGGSRGRGTWYNGGCEGTEGRRGKGGEQSGRINRQQCLRRNPS